MNFISDCSNDSILYIYCDIWDVHYTTSSPTFGVRNVFQFSSVQFSSVSQSCLTLCDPMNRSTPGLPAHHQLRRSLRLTSIESVMPSSHLILCHPFLLLPPISSSIRIFSNETTLCIRWPNYWSFSFSIIPSKEIPGLISFRMDWLDLLAVQGTLRSLPHSPTLTSIHDHRKNHSLDEVDLSRQSNISAFEYAI